MLATTASEALAQLQSQPTLITNLQTNIMLFRQILNKLEPAPLPESAWSSLASSSLSLLNAPSPSVSGADASSGAVTVSIAGAGTAASTIAANAIAPNKDAIIHIPSHPTSALVHIFLLNPPATMEAEERMLQEIVDECLNKHDVLITRARRLRGQEAFEPEPSLKVCISGAMSKKEVERCAKALKEVLIRVCASKLLPRCSLVDPSRQRRS